MAQSETKQCNQCSRSKPLDQFGSANGGKSKQPSCRECMTAKRAKWGKDNVQKLRDYDRARRAELPRRVFTHIDKIRFWTERAGICLCCAKPIGKDEVALAQLDHINPLSQGGSNTDENIALAHKRCNTDKHNKKIEDHWCWRYNQKLESVKLSYFVIKNITIAAKCRI